MATNAENLILGSGELYLVEASEIANPSNLTPEEESKLTLIGAIESGANVNIAKEYYEAKAYNRGTVLKIPIKTDILFKTGIINFNLENIAKFLYGSDYKIDTTNKTEKMVIGEADNAPDCYLRFVHTNKADNKKLTVNIYRAIFSGKQEFNFDEKVMVTNYEFTGLSAPVNINGELKYNYIEFIKYDPTMKTGV